MLSYDQLKEWFIEIRSAIFCSSNCIYWRSIASHVRCSVSENWLTLSRATYNVSNKASHNLLSLNKYLLSDIEIHCRISQAMTSCPAGCSFQGAIITSPGEADVKLAPWFQLPDSSLADPCRASNTEGKLHMGNCSPSEVSSLERAPCW